MHTIKTIGVIGTGLMGAPMARRLAEAGHRVRAWNRTPDKAAALRAQGIESAHSANDAATDADIVVVMLSSGPVCDAILLGDDGVIAHMAPGAVLVVMSSIPVDTARGQAQAAAAAGIGYLDAPVSGGEKGAIDGTLAIMIGGEDATYAQARPLFTPLGRAVHVGPAGSGQLAKLANQTIVANTIATVAEALLLAERGGADPGKVRDALMGGFADSTILKVHGERMLNDDFCPGGPAKWQCKDTQTAQALADDLALEMPVSRLVNGLFEDLVAHGDGDLDHSALIRELRRRNGERPS
ncbi:2-hydroxy-3-oxopropionate reductase [Chromohalobacter marismortui]|uniref:2-hydroxy-3-oxopropionate reductase n=1 Tax=Chromohalobacter marismortui TaxID=42055 RepID=A0A4R7NVK0_9GAMM|nr:MULTISPECIES: NAD(P)-dependent oxidoreductase [Chromohalobacter]MCI0511180.1 NAD(P)-dependent oxidoreductase [Chromohalobacter sp.]MCI0593584.1 NAD(P)-dependent oxidoreductase [Chromohalobacter sp.]TDU25205.1 2-hydroxy-3-oxopropionate reductase [Chromohalobacter marismortui]